MTRQVVLTGVPEKSGTWMGRDIDVEHHDGDIVIVNIDVAGTTKQLKRGFARGQWFDYVIEETDGTG